MPRPFYVTTAIFYANAGPHLGSALEIVGADAFARFKRLQGFDVFLLTGTDEHGEKIQKKAADSACTPQALVDRNADAFKAQFASLNIDYSDFIRTTEPRHRPGVEALLEKVRAKGDLYKGSYRGWYCTPCESFWTQAQLTAGRCPSCSREVHEDEEEVHFFRQSRYQQALLDHFKAHPGFVQPEGRGREMVNNFLAPGLGDLAISRSRQKVGWGLPFPGDPDHVVYVWFDALTNYLTGIGYPDPGFAARWPAGLHVIGKDILRFHAITWPAMLMSAGLPLPERIFSHGWVLAESGDKMSKSLGNTVDPTRIVQALGSDALRYALLREAPFAQDFVLTPDSIQGRYERDLGNDLGNLVYRTLSMTEKYFEGKAPPKGAPEAPEKELAQACRALRASYEPSMEALEFNRALEAVWSVVSKANQLVDQTKPWVLAKDPARRARLEAVLATLAETLAVVSCAAFPIIPTSAAKIREQLGLPAPASLDELGRWDAVKPGTPFAKGAPLFPRLEEKGTKPA